MKRKIAMILAMITVCSMVSCGSDSADESFDIKKSQSSSIDEDSKENEDSSETEKKAKQDEEKAKKLAEKEKSEAEKAEREIEEAQKRAKEEEEKIKKAEEEAERLAKEAENTYKEESNVKEESSAEETEAPDAEEEKPDDGFEMGEIKDKVYHSSFSGVTFHCPDNMTFADEEEILGIMNISKSVMDNKAAAIIEIAKQTTIYDMMARDSLTGDNIQLIYENLAQYGDAIADYDVDDYINVVIKQFDLLEDSQIKVSIKDQSEVKLGDQNFTKLELETYYETYDFTATQAYYVKKCGNYMLSIVITIGIDSEATLETYERLFT